MTNEDQLRVIRERLAAITPRHITANPMQWQQDGNYLLQLVTEQQREIERLKHFADLYEQQNRAKGYRKQERPM